ncbi:hypothetical protein VF14_18080 [Nostoc linckia z18]|uniref:Thioredoxin family protein n=2 Tax=Nostoc linckia TaxID=92942 RepID=A0A9Q5ZBM4_NOSLI|nr:hypothetical protein [Nostoc linckia]PHK41222.1 hypothetical protein VF12_07520 [Nostoc linckia z15]PHK45186.1 hypothetical protein VF13_17470 [Nostoc linckia z16]PHJ62427.1 hypothetical protein VF02_17310 [Nostoc linckia z1]PHJ62501.1 hypothetical protein VF05_26445 [Nostoc linckia z3]PHJ71260.1 hypothetical protein VF03_20505 [Nostoc linckia z2]
MKSIAKFGRRLVSVLLVVVVSTLMFLPSPAMAANWVTVNEGNFESELLKSDKTVIVLLVSDAFPEDVKTKLKSEVEKTYGDKYKLAVGSAEENGYIYNTILAPRIYPPFPGITVVKNGRPLQGIYINPNYPSQAFEFINRIIENS